MFAQPMAKIHFHVPANEIEQALELFANEHLSPVREGNAIVIWWPANKLHLWRELAFKLGWAMADDVGTLFHGRSDN